MTIARKFCLAIAFVASAVSVVCGQAQSRKLPGIINHPSMRLYAPYMSFDGNALLFVVNDGEDGALVVSYTSRETDWAQPAPLPKHINHRLTYLRGFALSADGKRMYFTASKSPVVGGYDIMTSELKGSTWSQPENLTVPVNSKAHEGSPSLSADGNMLFFMRCEKMDQRSASGCKLFSSRKKPNGQWDEPVELPQSINTGNSQTPRIMADNETLIFSSDKMPGNKGGMDLYLSRMKNGTWSAPAPLDFANTPGDDQFVSVAALGRYLLRDVPGARNNNELVEYLFPNALRPKGVMKVEGYVKDAANSAVPAYISVTDRKANTRVLSGRPAADGTYALYLPEGSVYELAVDPEHGNLTFFSRAIDLTGDKIAQRERINVTLSQPVVNDEILLEMTSRSGNADLDIAAGDELKRLVRMAKANPHLSFEINVTMSGYREDSLQTSHDLTEVRLDTIHMSLPSTDSLYAENQDSSVVKTTFHNDQSPAVATRILDFIARQGADKQRFTYKATAIAGTSEEKKYVVKALVTKSPGR